MPTPPGLPKDAEKFARSAAEAKRNVSPQKAKNKTADWSYALVAVLLLLIIDLAARAVFHPDPYASANRSFVYWTVKEFRERTDHPNLAVLGSSLMAAAVNDGDATFLNDKFDTLQHHRTRYLEHLLAEKGINARTATFALGGQMSSDVYAIASTLFTGERKPKAIVWGIAPRDFLDCTFKHPNSSETIHYLTKVQDGHDVLGIGDRDFWGNIERNLEGIFYLYRKRTDIVDRQLQETRKLLAETRGETAATPTRTPGPWFKAVLKDLPDDNYPFEWLATPYSPTNPPFPDNTEEYRQRYRRFDQHIFNTQVSFLDRTLYFCHQNNIQIMLINMPLQQSNLSLLPEGAYHTYLQRVAELADKYGASFVDFDQPGMFEPSEFGDTAHLNGLGGMHFFRLAADAIANNPSLCHSLESHPESE